MQRMIERFRDTARNHVTPEYWQYVMRGSAVGHSVEEAESGWHGYRLRPRVLRDASRVEVGLELFGAFATPVGIAPSAFHVLAHEDGEVATASAAAACGAPLVLSSRSTCRIEDVAAAVGGPWWFQVYVTKERAVTAGMVRRAAAAGASALVLTADTPYVGHRDVLGSGRPLALDDDLALINMGEHLSAEQRLTRWEYIEQDPSIGIETIEWLREIADVPVIVKGVLRGDDATAFADAGADGIWVSNHGGRQLDRSLTTAHALPDVVDAVGERLPVVVDGGIRDGFDALTALALGARAVFVGRPAVWALAAEGADGVTALITELTAELRHLMGLAGVCDLAELHAADLIHHAR